MISPFGSYFCKSGLFWGRRTPAGVLPCTHVGGYSLCHLTPLTVCTVLKQVVLFAGGMVTQGGSIFCILPSVICPVALFLFLSSSCQPWLSIFFMGKFCCMQLGAGFCCMQLASRKKNLSEFPKEGYEPSILGRMESIKPLDHGSQLRVGRYYGRKGLIMATRKQRLYFFTFNWLALQKQICHQGTY